MKYIILIITIIVCMLYIYKTYFTINESYVTYSKCNNTDIGPLINNAISHYNLQYTGDNKNSDIYIPCGYNHIETELAQMLYYNPRQRIFGISGCDLIVSKNNLWHLLESCIGRREAGKIMPDTYILDNSEHMRLFKSVYKPNTVYILKKNIQRKLGLKLTTDYREIIMAKQDNYMVVQKYINDSFTIKNRKLNLRMYLLITCHKGVVKSYISKLGKCIYTNKDVTYNINDLDAEKHLTSLNLNNDIYNTHPLTLTDFKHYLESIGHNSAIVFNNIYKILTTCMKCVSPQLCKLPNLTNNITFQLFGIDIIFDRYLNPYILEMNKGPDMIPKNQGDREIKAKVEIDVFDIIGYKHRQSYSGNDFIRLNV